MPEAPVVFVVTDPLCSWCWGTAAAIESARESLAGSARFDLVLGGINIDSVNPVGDYGRRRLARLWAEVALVTGQGFASAPCGTPFVYNSRVLCAVLEAVRETTGRPPFEMLHRLQYCFFARAEDVTSAEVLTECLASLGHDADAIRHLAAASHIRARVEQGFAEARRHGTHAMPSLILEWGGVRRLLAGGYVDEATLIATVEDALRKSSTRPA